MTDSGQATIADHAATPPVVVVAATYNRAPLAERLVAALEAQVGAPPFEVVIVDDCSNDDTPARLARLAERASVPLRTFRQDKRAGPGPARNRGWQASAAPLVLFTDDDCVPRPNWVATLAAAVAELDLVQGMTIPAPDQQAQAGAFSRTQEIREPSGTFQTCNMGYRREWLEAVDGFDEVFDKFAGEDTDMALRCLDRGAHFGFVPDAVVEHDVRPSSFLAALRDTWRWRGVVRTVANHPELEEMVGSRWFWRPSHPRAIAALGGAVAALALAARRRPALAAATAAAAALPYVEYRLRRAPIAASKSQRIGLLVPALLVDLGEVVALADGSFRYGKLFL